MADSITCPRCGRTSWNPNDVEQGYCGACHWWTSDPQLGQIEPPDAPFFECESIFTIRGRGPVLAGHVTGLVSTGDRLRCGERETLVKGVERHLVLGADTATHRRPVGLLVEGVADDYTSGTRWIIV